MSTSQRTGSTGLGPQQPPRWLGSFLFSASLDGPNSPRGFPFNAPSPVSIDKGIGINFDPASVGAANEGLAPDDPDYIGPKTRIFPKDIPGKWKQFLMGFSDWCERDGLGDEAQCVVWPREEYVRMWITCDEGLYMQRFGGVLDRVESILEALEKRQSRSVRAGAAKKKVDDMVEYAVRLATGARVLKDEDAAFRMLARVAKGPYSRDKIALADNMLCYLYKRRFSRDAILENMLTSLVFGDLASSNGPSTHCIFTLACFFAPFRDIDPYRGFTSLWKKFDDYRERWGLMMPGQKCCAVCGSAPKKMKGLKRCAGSCLIPRKPLYCGKACQKKHWLTHRKWCSKVFTPTESDIESDQYHTDYDDFDFDEDWDSEDDNSETYEDDEGDGKEWEDDDGSEDGDNSEEYPGSTSRASPDEDSISNDDGECYTTSGDSSTDDTSSRTRSRKSKNEHAFWTKWLDTKKRKKPMWNDDGDFDFDGFVMDIARSIVRLRNT